MFTRRDCVGTRSEVSDSNEHLTKNLPIVVAGVSSDLKLGGEVGGDRMLADLYVNFARMLGISSITNFGNNSLSSTGKTSGILA